MARKPATTPRPGRSDKIAVQKARSHGVTDGGHLPRPAIGQAVAPRTSMPTIKVTPTILHQETPPTWRRSKRSSSPATLAAKAPTRGGGRDDKGGKRARDLLFGLEEHEPRQHDLDRSCTPTSARQRRKELRYLPAVISDPAEGSIVPGAVRKNTKVDGATSRTATAWIKKIGNAPDEPEGLRRAATYVATRQGP